MLLHKNEVPGLHIDHNFELYHYRGVVLGTSLESRWPLKPRAPEGLLSVSVIELGDNQFVYEMV